MNCGSTSRPGKRNWLTATRAICSSFRPTIKVTGSNGLRPRRRSLSNCLRSSSDRLKTCARVSSTLAELPARSRVMVRSKLGLLSASTTPLRS
ncbi:hypothetical protein D9M71_790910 [compost metagenome]